MTNEIAFRKPDEIVTLDAGVAVPIIIAEAGENAAKRFLEFFAANIRNRNTRRGIITVRRITSGELLK